MSTANPKLESLRAELRSLLECPVKWEDFFGSHELIDQLYFLWLCMIRSYPLQVRSEGDLVNDINDVCNAHELSFDIANLKSWIGDVEFEYLKWVTLFHRIHLIDKTVRSKLWPSKSWTHEEVMARSGRKSGSIFYPEITAQELESTLQGIMGARFEEFLDKKHTRYFVDFVELIGAAHKEPTNHVCFEIDYSTLAYHAYPISVDEIPKDADVLVLVESNRRPYGKPIRAGDIRIVDPPKEAN
jgi:hypothetical protein